jgi:soluble lytic murein transglycosylase-like protein
MFRRLALACLLLPALVAPGNATVWKRERSDGTVEFTNAPRASKNWRALPESDAPAPARRSTSGSEAVPAAPASVVWTRERADGVVEFTNLQPVGKRWKVLFRTGPGKAAAVRGGSDLVPPHDLSLARYQRYDDHIRDQQAYFGIPQALVRAVIKTESDFDPRVVSSAGAQGLMQLMPGTARAMGVTDVWDPRQNIMGGCRYLQVLAKRFCRTPATAGRAANGGFVCSLDEQIKVLAGYHAGPGAVEKYGGMPPYETTRAYVTMVLHRFNEYRRREATLSSWTGSAQVAIR